MPTPAGARDNVIETLMTDTDRTYNCSVKIADPGGADIVAGTRAEPSPFVETDKESRMINAAWKERTGTLD